MFALWFYCANSDPEQARRGRILAGILLLFAGLALIPTLLNVLSGRPISPIIPVTLALLAGLYLLNRRGSVTVASLGLILMIVGVMLSVALDPQSSLPLAFLATSGMVIPVALAGVLLPWQLVVGLTLGASGVVTALYYGASPMLRAYEVLYPGTVTGGLVFALPVLAAVGGLAA
ncbi:MAG TPA: hypothetical protein VKY74_28095, partial [Chloroflexia bacterium]|nr:hypothetical protein [Chloroflexia bacterium]